MIIFALLQLKANTESLRRVTSERLRLALESGAQLVRQHRVYIRLPKDEDHNEAHVAGMVHNIDICFYQLMTNHTSINVLYRIINREYIGIFEHCERSVLSSCNCDGVELVEVIINLLTLSTRWQEPREGQLLLAQVIAS